MAIESALPVRISKRYGTSEHDGQSVPLLSGQKIPANSESSGWSATQLDSVAPNKTAKPGEPRHLPKVGRDLEGLRSAVSALLRRKQFLVGDQYCVRTADQARLLGEALIIPGFFPGLPAGTVGELPYGLSLSGPGLSDQDLQALEPLRKVRGVLSITQCNNLTILDLPHLESVGRSSFLSGSEFHFEFQSNAALTGVRLPSLRKVHNSAFFYDNVELRDIQMPALNRWVCFVHSRNGTGPIKRDYSDLLNERTILGVGDAQIHTIKKQKPILLRILQARGSGSAIRL